MTWKVCLGPKYFNQIRIAWYDDFDWGHLYCYDFTPKAPPPLTPEPRSIVLSADVKIHWVYFMFCGTQNRFRCPEKSVHIVLFKGNFVLSLSNFICHELFKAISHSKEENRLAGEKGFREPQTSWLGRVSSWLGKSLEQTALPDLVCMKLLRQLKHRFGQPWINSPGLSLTAWFPGAPIATKS